VIVTFEQAYEEAKKIESREGYTLIGLRWEFEGYCPQWVVTFMAGKGLKIIELVVN
jgi:hypothetical protein